MSCRGATQGQQPLFTTGPSQLRTHMYARKHSVRPQTDAASSKAPVSVPPSLVPSSTTLASCWLAIGSPPHPDSKPPITTHSERLLAMIRVREEEERRLGMVWSVAEGPGPLARWLALGRRLV